jgi:hypothetical protein
MRLIDASDLLLGPSRRVAKTGETAKDRLIYLPPEQIQTLIDQDRATWETLVGRFRDAVVPAVRAIDARAPADLLLSTDALNISCEKCHLTYWYPNERPKKSGRL